MSKPGERSTESYVCSESTTWAWKRVKILPPQSGPAKTSPKASKRPLLSRWPRRDPLTVVIRHRGGPESWWEIRARGITFRCPGWMAIEDIMDHLHGGR